MTRWKEIQPGVFEKETMSRYRIVGIDPKTKEYQGNTVEVYDTFVILYYDADEEFPFSDAEIKNLVKATQKDVVLLRRGTELRVVKVLKPREQT